MLLAGHAGSYPDVVQNPGHAELENYYFDATSEYLQRFATAVSNPLPAMRTLAFERRLGSAMWKEIGPRDLPEVQNFAEYLRLLLFTDVRQEVLGLPPYPTDALTDIQSREAVEVLEHRRCGSSVLSQSQDDDNLRLVYWLFKDIEENLLRCTYKPDGSFKTSIFAPLCAENPNVVNSEVQYNPLSDEMPPPDLVGRSTPRFLHLRVLHSAGLAWRCGTLLWKDYDQNAALYVGYLKHWAQHQNACSAARAN
ncbi:Hypothetical Protein FCC1311_118052, partial [Hondaea fermentalgiana]